MYDNENTIKLDKPFILKEDEATYISRCVGELLQDPRRYRLIDLFSGAGGMSLGFLEVFFHTKESIVLICNELFRNYPRNVGSEKNSCETDLFGRLWWDKPSVTIRTDFFKLKKGRYLHTDQRRPITHREAARFHDIIHA